MAKRETGDGEAERVASPAPAWDFAWIRGVSDALPMPIAYLDADRRYRFINQAFA